MKGLRTIIRCEYRVPELRRARPYFMGWRQGEAIRGEDEHTRSRKHLDMRNGRKRRDNSSLSRANICESRSLPMRSRPNKPTCAFPVGAESPLPWFDEIYRRCVHFVLHVSRERFLPQIGWSGGGERTIRDGAKIAYSCSPSLSLFLFHIDIYCTKCTFAVYRAGRNTIW